MKLRLSIYLTVALLLGAWRPAAATTSEWFAAARQEVAQTWREGSSEYYLPFHTVHMPWAYDEEQNKHYQNWPPGFGFGRGRFDAAGRWHGLYAMGFQDSHFKPEWVAGYGWKTYWQTPANVKLGLGYTVGLTTRTDIGHYTPVPYLLPIASVDYGRFALEGVFIPGGNSYGNVMLLWFKWHTDSQKLFGW